MLYFGVPSKWIRRQSDSDETASSHYLVRPLSVLKLVSGLFDWRESHGFEIYHEVNTAYVMRQTIEFIIIVMHVGAFKM